MIYFNETDERLYLTNLESQSSFCYLTGDYRKVWLLLYQQSQLSQTNSSQPVRQEIQQFFDFLVIHKLIPHNFEPTSVMSFLQLQLVDKKLSGEMQSQEDEFVYPAYASGGPCESYVEPPYPGDSFTSEVNFMCADEIK